MYTKAEDARKLKQQIREAIARHLDISQFRIFVFGSRVQKLTDDRADVDIGIEGENAVPRAILEKIQEELHELPTLYKIDVVDFKSVSDRFYRQAKKYNEPL